MFTKKETEGVPDRIILQTRAWFQIRTTPFKLIYKLRVKGTAHLVSEKWILPALADAIQGTACFNYLWQHNKWPWTERPKITPIPYLTASADQNSGCSLARLSEQSFRRLSWRCRFGCVLIWWLEQGKVHLPAPSGYWWNSFPGGCEIYDILLLQSHGGCGGWGKIWCFDSLTSEKAWIFLSRTWQGLSIISLFQ